jgi:MAPEG family
MDVPMADAHAFAGPITVTLIYFLVYYGFFMNQLRTKARLFRAYQARGEKFDRYFNQDREMLAADRYVLNTLEHMMPFLTLLWLNAVFVSATSATLAGAAYVFARAGYPLALGKTLGRNIPGSVLIATVPNYLVLFYFVGALAYVLLR